MLLGTLAASIGAILIAGTMAAVTATGWIYSAESIKMHFIEYSESSGGVVGEE